MKRVRGRRLKLVSLILLLAFSSAIAAVTGNPSTRLHIEPPELKDSTKQAGSTITVDLNITDVTDLYAWQTNMTWNASILSLTHPDNLTEFSFLKGPFQWKQYAKREETKPIWIQKKSATSSNTITAGWDDYPALPPKTIAECVDTDDTKYAQSSTPNAEEELGNFGIVTGNMSTVAKLEVGVMAWNRETNASEPYARRDKLGIQLSNGTDWGESHNLTIQYEGSSVKYVQWIDVTDDLPWTPSMLADGNLKVRMKYVQVGPTANRTRVDYVAVRVTDTLTVDYPGRAHDSLFDTYGSFRYSDLRGNLTIYDFTWHFPAEGVTDPSGEASKIVQVDFNMRYYANASTGNEYKIVYRNATSGTIHEDTLLDWTSAGAALSNYTWSDRTEPDDGEWDWLDVQNIRLIVETRGGTGDPYAKFRLYEAWVTVTYEIPTTVITSIGADSALFAVSIDGNYPGQTGSGKLASFDFSVTGYGESVINISDPVWTYLLDSPPNQQYISFTPEDGYFDNYRTGDFDKDGDVDPDDFGVFAGAYGSSPPSNPDCDFDDDGDVDPDDFGVFAGAYGWSL